MDGDEVWQHLSDFLQVYVCDGKMYFEILPLKHGQCRKCKTSLADGDHNIAKNLIPADPHTLEEFQHAHDRFMHHYNEFSTKNIHKHLVLLSNAMSTASLNLFYASEEFKNFEEEYVDGVGTNPAKLGDRYKGLLVDRLTPLEHYLVDTLHFEIILANICMTQLIVPLAQEIEDAHPGRGIWAFCAACKAAGLKHLGGRLKQHSLLKKKIVTEGCEITSDVVSEAAPRTTKIVNFFVSKYVPKWKVEDLRSALIKLKPELKELVSRRGKHGLDKAALIKELTFQLCQLPAEEVILRWIPPAELYEIENHHAFLQAEAMVVGSENAQLQELAVASGFKLQGRDAKTVLEAGGGEIMIRMLNAIRYNAVLVQNDALT